MRLNIFCLVLICAVAATSCRKVIDINLNDAAPKFVVEAVISNIPDSCRVLLSKTVNFSNDNNVPPVTGATVTIADDEGNTTTLNEVSAGVYQPVTFNGMPGVTYHLTVKTGDATFTATSTMPQQVHYDSLYITETTLFDGLEKVATVQYKDPPGKGNSYRYIQYRNGIREKTIFVENDELTDGRLVNTELLIFGDNGDTKAERDKKKLKSGDTLRVDMMCIDPAVYKYWYSLLNSSTGSNNNATPANPVTNISGGALGYFSAQTFQTKTILVP